MEKLINVLQQMSIERNKVENDLIDLRQQQTNEQSEKIRIENMLLETNQRLVSHRLVAKSKQQFLNFCDFSQIRMHRQY